MKKMFALTLALAFVFAFAAVVAADGSQYQEDAAKAPKSFDKPQKPGTKATCPVMGNEFTITEQSPFSVYKGRYYYFCCPGCKPQFDADPAKYAE